MVVAMEGGGGKGEIEEKRKGWKGKEGREREKYSEIERDIGKMKQEKSL